MQSIVHQGKYDYLHPIFLEFENLYRELSNDDEPKRLFPIKFDINLKVFENIFNTYGNCIRNLTYENKQYERLPKINSKKNIIIGFSGGKDSTATAIYFKERGFNVYLYHVHGLNKFFPQELESAKEVAEKLELPLIVEDVKLSGKSLYPDHPLKNIIIANMALQWGIKNNVSVHLAMGDYYTTYLDYVDFETSGDDCIEMWRAYKGVIRQYIPNFKLETPLVDIEDTLGVFVSNPDLLQVVQSCVMTYRFKAKHRERMEKVYNVQLLPNRCGCCWKDCVEYVWFTDNDLLDLNKAYYKHCLEVLWATLHKKTGEKYSLTSVWDEYFFYPMSKSKLYKEIKDATFSTNGKIKCSNEDIKG